MPRTTDHDYLATHQQLHALWTSGPTGLFLLSGMEQWALHEYYRLSEQLPDAALLEHRRVVRKMDQSLPQRAGRALSKLQAANGRLEDYWAQVVPMPRPRMTKKVEKEIRIFSEVHPTLDPAKMAKILMHYKRRN
jgi:hypothetical protein